VLGNHDRKRVASRVGHDQARVAAMLLLTLRGTPTLYYGDEIGMEQVDIPPDRVRDPFEKNLPGIGVGRDGCRTPMQWDATPHTGFSSVEPWLPLSPTASSENVAIECGDKLSMLNLYRALIALRIAKPALALGCYRCLAVTDSLLAFERKHREQRLLVVLNFRAELTSIALTNKGQILLSTFMDRQFETATGELTLRAAEGIIFEPLD
jgi:alpha-glucosidase